MSKPCFSESLNYLKSMRKKMKQIFLKTHTCNAVSWTFLNKFTSPSVTPGGSDGFCSEVELSKINKYF